MFEGGGDKEKTFFKIFKIIFFFENIFKDKIFLKIKIFYFYDIIIISCIVL